MLTSRNILGKVLILHKRGDRMKINSKMQKFLDEVVNKEKQSEIKIDFNTAKNIIFPEFFEWEGCVLLRQERNHILPSQFSPNQFIPDRTAFEADYNHVHLNDFFSENFSPFQVFILATKIIEVWSATFTNSPTLTRGLFSYFPMTKKKLYYASIRSGKTSHRGLILPQQNRI